MHGMKGVVHMKKEKEESKITELPADRLLTTDEVAEVLGGTDRTFVNRIINAGLLLAIRFGPRKKVPTSVLNQFIEDFTGLDIVAEVEKAEKIEAARKKATA